MPVSGHVIHPFGPLFDENARVLILGSFPSVRSREQGFFYGHPQNRFWPLLAALFGEEPPRDLDAKKALALRHRIALWDVIASCDIAGSGDSSIRNAVPTDLRPVLERTRITRVFCNGGMSGRCYERFQRPRLGLEAQVLPSTSPANAAWSFARLLEAWQPVALAAGDGGAAEIPPTGESARKPRY